MMLDSIRDLISDKDPTPNKFTIEMGKLIRKAREESGISQAELARLIYRRQATLSDIENGKTDVSSGTLILLAAALEKPISYFFPPFVNTQLKPEELSPLEQEALSVFQNIWSDHLRKIAIGQIRVLSNLDPIDMIGDQWESISEILRQREEQRNIKHRE